MEIITAFKNIEADILGVTFPPPEMLTVLNSIDQKTRSGTERKARIIALRLILNSKKALHDYVLSELGMEDRKLSPERFEKVRSTLAAVNAQQNKSYYKEYFDAIEKTSCIADNILNQYYLLLSENLQVLDNPYEISAGEIDITYVATLERKSEAESEPNPLLSMMRYQVLKQVEALNKNLQERVEDLAHSTAALVRDNSNPENKTFLRSIATLMIKTLMQEPESQEAKIYRETLATHNLSSQIYVNDKTGECNLAFCEITKTS